MCMDYRFRVGENPLFLLVQIRGSGQPGRSKWENNHPLLLKVFLFEWRSYSKFFIFLQVRYRGTFGAKLAFFHIFPGGWRMLLRKSIPHVSVLYQSLVLVSGCGNSQQKLKFDSRYQADFLANGRVFLGKIFHAGAT